MIYMDASAGTKPYSEVIETITDVLKNHWGNASAEYSLGNDAKNIINNITKQVAIDINCKPSEIVWTSGACEANSLAVIGTLNAYPNADFYTTHLEHTSIMEITKNIYSPVFFIKNDAQGFIDLYSFNKILKEQSYNKKHKILVSISAANSEIGTIHDIKRIARIVHK